MASARFNSSSRGFSLIEVIISMALLTIVSLGVAQVFAMSTRANYVARGQTSTTAMAEPAFASTQPSACPDAA